MKAIKTYEDLTQEEERLSAQLVTYKTMIQADLAELKKDVKDKLNPIKQVKEKVKNLFTAEGKNGPALNAAIKFVTDFTVKSVLPNKYGMLTKTVIPFITHNYITHLVTDEQRKSISKFVNKMVGKADKFIRKTIKKKQEEHLKTEMSVPPGTPPVFAPGA